MGYVRLVTSPEYLITLCVFNVIKYSGLVTSLAADTGLPVINGGGQW